MIIVQATPFNAGGSLDVPGLRANTQFLIDKCQGRRFVLVPTGSTGEAYALSDSERIKAIETVIDRAAGALPVVAASSGPSAARRDRRLRRRSRPISGFIKPANGDRIIFGVISHMIRS